MRRGELLGLRWSDVDFEGRRLSIRQTVIAVGYKIEVSEPKTDASRRSIVLDGATLADLGKHRARQSAERLAQDSLYVQNDLVFAALDGSPLHPQNVSAAFRRLCKSASLPVIRFHDLRHSYATAALSTDVHQKVVSERLGHSSIAITMDTYSHVMPSVAEEGALRIAAVIHGARTA